MNREYTYVDGKCIVYDENGAIKTEDGKIDLKEYSNNFDEILVQENLIESLEKDLEETKQDIEKREKLVKSNKKMMIFDVISFGSIPVLIQQLLKFMFGKEQVLLMFADAFLGPFLKIFVLSVTILFGGAFTLATYNSYKYNKKRLNGQKCKQTAIESSLEQAKQKLEKLNQEKETTKLEENICSNKVNYLNRLIQLRDYLDVYYGCGFNQKKYEKYYLDGTLEKKLEKKYTKEQIKQIKEYFEQKFISERLQEELSETEGYSRKLK